MMPNHWVTSRRSTYRTTKRAMQRNVLPVSECFTWIESRDGRRVCWNGACIDPLANLFWSNPACSLQEPTLTNCSVASLLIELCEIGFLPNEKRQCLRGFPRRRCEQRDGGRVLFILWKVGKNALILHRWQTASKWCLITAHYTYNDQELYDTDFTHSPWLPYPWNASPSRTTG